MLVDSLITCKHICQVNLVSQHKLSGSKQLCDLLSLSPNKQPEYVDEMIVWEAQRSNYH